MVGGGGGAPDQSRIRAAALCVAWLHGRAGSWQLAVLAVTRRGVIGLSLAALLAAAAASTRLPLGGSLQAEQSKAL